MTALSWLIPAALVLGSLGLIGFLWTLKSGQYDDLEGAAWRAIQDDDDEPNTGTGSTGRGDGTGSRTAAPKER